MPAATSPSRAKSKDTVAPITVKLSGTALDPGTLANKLNEVVVKKIRVLPDMAYVRLHDPGQTLVDRPPAKLGDELEVLTGGPSDAVAKTLFKGVITGVEPEFRDDGVYLAFRAYDKGHAMTRSKHTRVFQNQTIGDIVTAVAQPYFSVAVDGSTGAAHEYMMQSNESDWDFVWRLAGMIGFELATSETGAKFRAVGKSDGDGPWLQYGQSEPGHRLFSFRPRVTNANLPENVSGKYVNAQGQMVTASVSLADGKISTLDKAPGSMSAAGPIEGKGDFAIANIVAKDEKELRLQVEAVRDKILASAVEAEGLAEGDPELKPGVQVEMRGLGKYSGKYLLSETVHVYRGASGFRTRFHIAARPKSLLEAVSPNSSQAARSAENSIVQGEVTNVNDPDKMGRIRVKLPTMAQEDDPEGWWARIATPSAGEDRGLLMLPNAGDKVIVGFENGDTRKPVILGSVWDGKSLPGKDLVKDDGSFALRSQKAIYMKATDKMDFHSDAEWKAKIGKAITFEATDSITIKSSKEIILKAPNIKIEADAKIDMKSAQVAVNGSATLELKAPSVTVGGGMVKLG